MKKKKRLWIFIVLAVLIGGYLTVRVTGMLQFFSIPTNSSEPALNTGQSIISSSLVSPKRFDYIVFNYSDSLTEQKEYRVFRLCGMPGDTIEIRNGDLFVNHKNTSPQFDICLPYFVSANDIEKITQLVKLDEQDVSFTGGPDKAEVILSRAECEIIKAQNISFERRILNREEPDEWITKTHGHPWNADQFGPLAIPKDHYFVLGDNRHRANDSRYSGLVPIRDFHGTVISR